jgi:GntR family transcriptional regulator, transcriptional repressor for pyruvate dehydrogenase complex
LATRVTDDGSRGRGLFRPVERETTLPDKVAGQLRQLIVDGVLKGGDRLPSERDLGEQFTVSRTVVREAVRYLLAQGLIETTVGRGYRVAYFSGAPVHESMALYLRGRPLAYEQIHEVRATIEVTIAGLAAKRATSADIEAMEAACLAMENADDDDAAARADLLFHNAVIKAGGNELFVVMLTSIEDVLLDIRRETVNMPGRRKRGVAAHREIARWVGAGDGERASAAMQAHLDDSLAAWRILEQKSAKSAPSRAGF